MQLEFVAGLQISYILHKTCIQRAFFIFVLKYAVDFFFILVIM